jgi:predicted acyltransferase
LPSGAFPEVLREQLYHSAWHGLTWVDFSYAGFMMLMGLSVRLSLKRLKEDGLGKYFEKVLFRTLALLLLGFLYNGGFVNAWPDVRLCGVLQRMGVCYFAAAVAYRFLDVRGWFTLLSGTLLGYWAIMALVPVPGGTAGDYTFSGNLAAWIDSKLLPGRLYYGTWDSEGLLTTIPAIGSSLIGLLWGELLLSNQTQSRKAAKLAVGGVLALNVAVLWDTVMPINKPLWTSSFVLATAGVGSMILAAFYYLVEILSWRKLVFPFVVVGRNLLAAFIMVRVLPFHSISLRFTGGDVSLLLGKAAPFFTAFVEIALLWGILLFLYRKGIAIRL